MSAAWPKPVRELNRLSIPREDQDGFGPADVMALTNVSRETLERVDAYLAVLSDWRTRINLIGPSEDRHIWRRHVLDSLQLAPLVPSEISALADLGSGAGFPGILLACDLAGRSSAQVYLVEKSVRKSEFLAAAVEKLGLTTVVLNQKIEDPGPRKVDVLTARALAPLPKLLAMSKGWLGEEGRALFPKGRDAAAELTQARYDWTFGIETRPSLSSPDGQVLIVSSLRPV
jgi:16S rRNA (guanine527-N7)-methyltransferase